MSPLPLERYELFRSKDLEEARELVGHVLYEHRLEFFGGSTRLDARMHSHRIGHVTVNYLSYGADVSIETRMLDSFYVVQIPVSGRSLLRYRGEKVFSTPKLATVISPTEHVHQLWTHDCAQLVLRIERSAMHARLRDMIGTPLWEPLIFEPELDVTTGFGSGWLREVRNLIAELDSKGPSPGNPFVAQELERALMTGLLAAHRHNYSAVFEDDNFTIVPSQPVHIALELIESHPEYQHSVSSLARAANVSERTLHAAFNEHVQMSPKAYLTEVRLKRARDELRAAHPRTMTVSQVARALGFGHLGRFAMVYRKRFGERPSDTLRR